MRKAELVAEFPNNIKTVWNVVTDNVHYEWRSDLSRIEVSEDGNSFTEYTKDGFQTKFIIQRKDECHQYEFTMENAQFTGYWIGRFSKTESGGTIIVFIENIQMSNPVKELLSRLFFNLNKIQQTYVADLRRRLEELEAK